jgi:hypothetical protein
MQSDSSKLPPFFTECPDAYIFVEITQSEEEIRIAALEERVRLLEEANAYVRALLLRKEDELLGVRAALEAERQRYVRDEALYRRPGKRSVELAESVALNTGMEPLLDETDYDEPTEPGYIYVLKSATGLYKIGRTANPTSRLYSLRCADPTIEPVLFVLTRGAVTLEAALQARHESSRMRGEWFALKASDIEQIKAAWTKCA